jgi:hypothetical protein
MKKLHALVLLAALAFSSCSSMTIGHGDEPPTFSREYTLNVFLWGIVGDQLEVDPSERVHVYRGPFDLLAGILTLGLWTPWSAEVWAKND